MKIPFSAENLISDDRNAPVSRSRAVLALAPGRDTGVQGRDVGAQASGTIGDNGRSVEYAAGVFRGQTFIYVPRVHYNAAAGRVIFHPLSGLSAGADWYGSFSARPGAWSNAASTLKASTTRGRASIRAEQILARDGTRERRGGYLLGVWRLKPNSRPSRAPTGSPPISISRHALDRLRRRRKRIPVQAREDRPRRRRAARPGPEGLEQRRLRPGDAVLLAAAASGNSRDAIIRDETGRRCRSGMPYGAEPLATRGRGQDEPGAMLGPYRISGRWAPAAWAPSTRPKILVFAAT